jgi:hypothetical protein
MVMANYVFDAYLIDTTPGNPSSPFSPESGWAGDADAYLVWLRERFRADPGIRQRMAIAARGIDRGSVVTVNGDYKELLYSAIANFGKRRLKGK